MKTVRIIILCMLLSATQMSCSDFLNQMPSSKLSSEQLFTPEDIQALELTVDGLYASFKASKAGREQFTFTLLGLDESKQGLVQIGDANQSGLDYYNGALNGASPQVSAMWSKRWPMINTAAKAIYGLGLFAEHEADANRLKRIEQLRAHACFVRALAMFEMTMYWGEIPVVELPDLTTEISMARQPLNVVWKQIFDDLIYASDKMEDGRQTGPRARKGAAIAMLGKACMYSPEAAGYRDFGKAAEQFALLESRYDLEGEFGKLFDEFGWMQFTSVESIFEIDFAPNSTGFNNWMWDLGSRTMAGQRGKNGVENGEGCYMGGYDVALPTEYAYRMKNEGGVWETGDLRRAESIREDYTYNGIPAPASVSWMADELDPHIKKWEDRRVDQFATAEQAKEATNGRSMYYSGLNYAYLRYGDILLCRAECLNETGKTAEAMAMVNRVRTRAWGGTLPADKTWSGLSQEQFRKEIMDERIRELCFEGWRRMDLIRTGTFVELVSTRNPWAKKNGTIREHHLRWPIPNDELNNNPDMDPAKDQNRGY